MAYIEVGTPAAPASQERPSPSHKDAEIELLHTQLRALRVVLVYVLLAFACVLAIPFVGALGDVYEWWKTLDVRVEAEEPLADFAEVADVIYLNNFGTGDFLVVGDLGRAAEVPRRVHDFYWDTDMRVEGVYEDDPREIAVVDGIGNVRIAPGYTCEDVLRRIRYHLVWR